MRQNAILNSFMVLVTRVLTMPKDFWHNFQLYLRENQLPSYLVKILKITGYDSAISIELLNKEKIKEIESDIQNRFSESSASSASRELFKKTVYENVDVKKFEFLPGHITLFLALGPYIKKYLEKSFRDDAAQSQRLYSESLDIIEEEIELISEKERAALKENLIKKFKAM